MYSTLKTVWEVKQDIYDQFSAEMDKGELADDNKLDNLQDQLSLAAQTFSDYVDIAINDGIFTSLGLINEVQKWTESRMRKNLKKA